MTSLVKALQHGYPPQPYSDFRYTMISCNTHRVGLFDEKLNSEAHQLKIVGLMFEKYNKVGYEQYV